MYLNKKLQKKVKPAYSVEEKNIVCCVRAGYTKLYMCNCLCLCI